MDFPYTESTNIDYLRRIYTIMDMKQWFKEAQYGMMVHWGLYSLLGGEYKDRYSGIYAEWIQAHLAIPNAEYGKLTKDFKPVLFDAEE